MKKIIGILIVAFACVLCSVAIFGRRATLITLEPLQLSQTIDGKSTIAQIATDTRLPVVRCIDTKSLIIPEIKLPDQKIGYAVFGKFRMEYASAFNFSTSAPISFSCP
jgi:hypothetical protein